LNCRGFSGELPSMSLAVRLLAFVVITVASSAVLALPYL
jgi:hypothetical protein